MTKIFIFGSCRIWDTTNFCTQLNPRTLMHDISQYIQEIQFYQKIKPLNEQLVEYMYYNEYKQKIIEQKELALKTQLEKLQEADIVIAEICTLKYILVDGTYYDLQKCASYPRGQFSIKTYDKKTFQQKVREFIELIPNKKILFVGHIYDANFMTNSKLKVRQVLNSWINELVDHARTHFFNPSSLLEKFPYKQIMLDTSHYNKKGKKIVKGELKIFLAKIINHSTNLSV